VNDYAEHPFVEVYRMGTNQEMNLAVIITQEKSKAEYKDPITG
jgi:hypothetical protein